jgi:hypothetical protein
MSKKHFIAIAEAIKLQYAQATTFKNDKNLFDAKRFREACGIEK